MNEAAKTNFRFGESEKREKNAGIIYKFDQSRGGLAGLSYNEGQFSVVGYVTDGIDLLDPERGRKASGALLLKFVIRITTHHLSLHCFNSLHWCRVVELLEDELPYRRRRRLLKLVHAELLSPLPDLVEGQPGLEGLGGRETPPLVFS